ncbi:UNVERIFIED_CONTAM: hypothetical protein NCL1_40243 [Trichonephila clavipes]
MLLIVSALFKYEYLDTFCEFILLVIIRDSQSGLYRPLVYMTTIKVSTSRRCWFFAAPLPKAKENPNSILPFSTSEVGACFREKPLRGGGGEKTASSEPQPHRNTGKQLSMY